MKKTPLKRKSKSPRSKLIAQADTLWSKVVRLRANGLCEWCGEPCKDAHHMYGRRNSMYLRHCLENGVAVCAKCHFRFHKIESNSGWKKFEEQRPSDYAHVVGNMYEVHKLTLDDFRDVISYLEITLKQLEEQDAVA